MAPFSSCSANFALRFSINELTDCSVSRGHPAGEVYVTGTFDDWAKSVKLEKKGGRFEKLLDLAQTEEKIFYKVCGVSCAPRILEWFCAYVHTISMTEKLPIDWKTWFGKGKLLVLVVPPTGPGVALRSFAGPCG